MYVHDCRPFPSWLGQSTFHVRFMAVSRSHPRLVRDFICNFSWLLTIPFLAWASDFLGTFMTVSYSLPGKIKDFSCTFHFCRPFSPW